MCQTHLKATPIKYRWGGCGLEVGNHESNWGGLKSHWKTSLKTGLTYLIYIMLDTPGTSSSASCWACSYSPLQEMRRRDHHSGLRILPTILININTSQCTCMSRCMSSLHHSLNCYTRLNTTIKYVLMNLMIKLLVIFKFIMIRQLHHGLTLNSMAHIRLTTTGSHYYKIQ